MKYTISWKERPQGTPIEYENAQKRILEVFSPWKAVIPVAIRVELEAMAYREGLKNK